ncbi:MAG TPA: G1 family glutamic endopeptidase, partial [Candidatus Limnocylindria bacterium]|nr:G1 family glutamic endopeptidase [Candidatus Limnocylindria bacterium]
MQGNPNEGNASTITDGRPTRRSSAMPIGVAIVLVIALVGAAAVIGRNGSTPLASATPQPTAVAGASATPASSPQSDPAAVQAVIQKANDEQQQAFAQNDPTLMQDTATAGYYAQLVQVDAALRSAGVTAIQLLSLNFAQTTVQGSSAQVATTESWRATFADGTTTDDTTLNNYTLVLTGGAWKISRDTQPSANIPPGATPSGPPATVGSTSRNWSGYVASSGTFTAVSGTWTIPTVSASTSGTSARADATWVGIGGATSTDLVQAGTQATVVNGVVQYSAWVETLPQASRDVSLAVTAGDTVTVSLAQETAGTWNITIQNTTSGGVYNGTVTYASSVSSAEWIEEAPTAGKGGVVVLDQFGTVQFANASTVKDGQT